MNYKAMFEADFAALDGDANGRLAARRDYDRLGLGDNVFWDNFTDELERKTTELHRLRDTVSFNEAVGGMVFESDKYRLDFLVGYADEGKTIMEEAA